MYFVLCIVYGVLCIMYYVLCITYEVLCIMYYVMHILDLCLGNIWCILKMAKHQRFNFILGLNIKKKLASIFFCTFLHTKKKVSNDCMAGKEVGESLSRAQQCRRVLPSHPDWWFLCGFTRVWPSHWLILRSPEGSFEIFHDCGVPRNHPFRTMGFSMKQTIYFGVALQEPPIWDLKCTEVQGIWGAPRGPRLWITSMTRKLLQWAVGQKVKNRQKQTHD